jgi:Ca2+-binding RTX toxin-like protein
MRQNAMTTGRRPARRPQARKDYRRRLGYERLEARQMLTVALAGVQTVGLWQMSLDINSTTRQGDVLAQTAANFTFTGTRQQINTPLTVNWGDGSPVYHGTFNFLAVATTTHTFASGNFTVTVTCGADVTRYVLASAMTALGKVSGSSSQTDALFLVGNDQAHQMSVTLSNGTLTISSTNPSYSRSIASSLVASIYASTGNGNDSVTLATNVTQSAFFSLGNGEDYFHGGGGNDTVLSGTGNDTIYGGNGNNTIIGGGGNDQLYGGAGSDVIYGGNGNDTIHAGTGNDQLFGGDGNDTIYGGAGNDILEADAGNDTLVAGSGKNYLYGGSGNCILRGGSGSDWLFGGDGNAQIYCGSGPTVAIAGHGADHIYGGSGRDIIGGGYDFELHYMATSVLDTILAEWATYHAVPTELSYTPGDSSSSPNTALWDSGAADVLARGTGPTLFYTGKNDTIVGQLRSGVDVRAALTMPTAYATINYTTTSGIVDPTGDFRLTTTLLGRYSDDMQTIIGDLQLRKTCDFSANVGGFQVLNVPDALYITSSQFWTDFNQPFLQASMDRNDVILAMTVPSSGGGYGSEITLLQDNGFLYDISLCQFVNTHRR